MTSKTDTLPYPDVAHSDPVDAKAAEWAAYLHSGQVSEEGLAVFRRWITASPEHAKAFERVQSAWAKAGVAILGAQLDAAPSSSLPPSADRRREKRSLAQRPSRAQGGARATRRQWAAAVLAGCLATGLGVGGWWMTRSTAPLDFAYETARGEIRIVTLDDGTRVTLGGATALSGAFDDDTRTVQVRQGRAFFEVAHNEARPFVATVASVEVTVLGTAFDVEKGPDSVRVSVDEGEVSVSPSGADDAASALNAGEQIEASLQGELGEVHPFDVLSLSWRSGRLEYVDARLKDVIAEVNRYRATPVVLADETVADLRVSLGVDTDQTDVLLSGIEATLPVRVARSPLGVVISSTSADER